MGRKLLRLGLAAVPTLAFAALFLAASGGFSWWSWATLLLAVGAGAIWLGGSSLVPQPLSRGDEGFATLVESLPEPVLLVDDAGRLLCLNPKAAELLGAPRSALVGKCAWPLLGPPLAENLRGHAEAVGRERRPRRAELPQGGRWTEARLYPTGRGVGLYLLDVTEHVERLEQARELARSRAELLLLASHELRTPLGALTLQLQGLERAGKRAAGALAPERMQAGLERAVRQVERLARLVETMLDFSRLESGGLQLEREPLDLGQLVGELAARFAPQAEQAGCVLELDLQPGVCGNWDRLRLEQVAGNLLSNALKYGAGRPVQLLVRGDADTAWLTVRDQGMGVAAAQQEQIFGRFQRTDEARRFAGVGVGLYISRKLVLAHGGHIGVQSSPGRGATFAVALPKSAQPVAACEGRPAQVHAPVPAPAAAPTGTRPPIAGDPAALQGD